MVLALPHWRLLATWMTVDMLVWPILMWHMLGTDNKGLPGEFLNIVVLARDGLIIAMMVLVVMQMLGRLPRQGPRGTQRARPALDDARAVGP